MSSIHLFAFLELAALPAGCSCLYLASPNQRWLANALPYRGIRRFGVVLLVASLLALIKRMQPAAAIFVFIISVMLLFILFSYVGALISAKRGR
ncbi:MAG: hypothetical protein H6R04_504 [Burkholderiaceae bacterium]|nr:hypothetical protein [Burkholderiaceae bacterium]